MTGRCMRRTQINLTTAMDDVGDDGRVVRELDVYLCAGNVPEATKV